MTQISMVYGTYGTYESTNHRTWTCKQLKAFSPFRLNCWNTCASIILRSERKGEENLGTNKITNLSTANIFRIYDYNIFNNLEGRGSSVHFCPKSVVGSLLPTSGRFLLKLIVDIHFKLYNTCWVTKFFQNHK